MKKKTAIFIDYESWYYGLLNLHGDLPDVEGLLSRLEDENDVVVRRAFGNLPVTEDRNLIEKDKLEKFNFDLEYTFEGNVKDDLTDFVLVDSIYRLLMVEPSIEKYIIFSGDAHYLQVIRTLVDLNKEVEIWAVAGTLSDVFDEYNANLIYPNRDDELAKLIVDEVRLQSALGSPVFQKRLIDNVCYKHSLEEDNVRSEVISLLSMGVLKEVTYTNIKRRRVHTIAVNKDYIG